MNNPCVKLFSDEDAATFIVDAGDAIIDARKTFLLFEREISDAHERVKDELNQLEGKPISTLYEAAIAALYELQGDRQGKTGYINHMFNENMPRSNFRKGLDGNNLKEYLDDHVDHTRGVFEDKKSSPSASVNLEEFKILIIDLDIMFDFFKASAVRALKKKIEEAMAPFDENDENEPGLSDGSTDSSVPSEGS